MIVDTSTTTIGDLCDAVAEQLCQGNGLRPDMLDYDETTVNLATTVFDMAQTFGQVARRLGWLKKDPSDPEPPCACCGTVHP